MSAERRGNSEAPKDPRTEVKLDSPLKRYIASFGLDPVRDLLPQDIGIFAAARKLEHYIEKMKIPVAKKLVDPQKMVLVEEEVERIIPRTTYTEGEERSSVPTDSMDVHQIEKITELPDILPGQWLREEMNEDVFLTDAATGRLLRRQYLETTRTPHTSHETIQEKVLIEKPAPPEDERRHAYVLLDVSGSMSNGGKEIAGKALALAFLRKGFMERSQLYLLPFTDHLGTLKKGKTEDEFKKMTLDILHKETASGGTDIQKAVEKAVEDITKGGEFAHADILLITDGDSYLYGNPLGKINLHTLILDPSYSEPDRTIGEKLADKAEAIVDRIKRIKEIGAPQSILESWSKTYKVINTSEFEEYSSKETRDLEREIIQSFPDRFPHDTIDELQKLMEQNSLLQSALEAADQLRRDRSLSPQERQEINEIMSQIRDLMDPYTLERRINHKREEQRAKEWREEKEARERERDQKRASDEALRELQQLLGETPDIEMPQPQTRQQRRVPRDENYETPEEALEKLQNFTDQPSDDIEIPGPENEQPKRTPRHESRETPEEALERLQNFTGQTPDDIEIPDNQGQQSNAQSDSQPYADPNATEKARGGMRPTTDPLPKRKASKQKRGDTQPTGPTPEELSNQARETLDELTGKRPQVDHPHEQQRRQEELLRQKTILQKILEAIRRKRS